MKLIDLFEMANLSLSVTGLSYKVNMHPAEKMMNAGKMSIMGFDSSRHMKLRVNDLKLNSNLINDFAEFIEGNLDTLITYWNNLNDRVLKSSIKNLKELRSKEKEEKEK